MTHDKDEPLDPKSNNESKNGVLYNATRKQSSVSPEDYPDAEKQSRSGSAPPRRTRD